MNARYLHPSLRRSLILAALVVVVIATVAMSVALSVTLSQRNEIDRDANAFIEEQRIADQIVALTYQQQLAAYRYLREPGESHRATFLAQGDEVDVQMRRYLFHRLSSAARLQVERMKESHEEFEVVARRAFDLAERGETAQATARLPGLDAHAAALDSAVTRFLDARLAQRAELQQSYRVLTARVRGGLLLVGLGLALLALWLTRHLRGTVLVPLEQLTAAAQRIQGGDALARVAPQRYAELAEVGTAFNAMADAVQLSRETVEMQNEELRQSLEQLQETQEELVQHEKLSAMGQMLAGLAHELNNPLGGILGMAQLLRAELAASPHEETRRIDTELANPIEREAVRARELVRSLLSFARKPTGRVDAVPLTAAVGTAVALRAHAFAQAGRTLRVDIPPTLFVMADGQKLQHAVVNLLNNALDALTSSNGTILTITAAAESDEWVVVRFDDDGPGFTDASAAFDPFYTTKPAERGTGLGLALVRQFMNEFGGSATAANRPGGGARVTLRFHRASAPPAEAVVPDEGEPAAREAPSAPDAAPLAATPGRRRVLVVDDEPSLREVQRRVLMLEGIDVLLAENGDQARRILAREHVDLVVSDLRMPGSTDGRGLLAILQEEHPALAARTIIVTGDVSGVASARVPVPTDRVIRKPFTRAEYVARIRKALDQIPPG